MMMFARDLVQFADIEQLCKVVKMEHCVVFAVLAKKCDILAEVHIFEVIRNKTAVATLDALAELEKGFVACFHAWSSSIYPSKKLKTENEKLKMKESVFSFHFSDLSFSGSVQRNYFTTPLFEELINSISKSTSAHPLISACMRSTACVVFSLAESSK